MFNSVVYPILSYPASYLSDYKIQNIFFKILL
nr:MAG TPA: hypothetical protein [Caudoviricetes sp.]